jgi:hypothetical protein
MIEQLTKSMRRARRSARAVLHGPEILEFVSSKEGRRLIFEAAKAGVPPVTALSTAIIEKIGERDAKLIPVKQFIGVCVRAVLEDEGFEIASKGVRVSNDPLFSTGATYQPIRSPSVRLELLERFLRALNDEEVQDAIRILRRRRLNASR